MAMTPDEIRAKSFPSVKKGGADVAVVNAFLAEVAEELTRLEHAAQAAQSELVALASAHEEAATDVLEPAKPTIDVVGTHVDELLKAAQRSADAIVRDAGKWASSHKTEADGYATTVRSEVDELRHTTEQQAESFREETVEYANIIRIDAESAAKTIVEQAEADAAAQYGSRATEIGARWDAIKTAERELLAALNDTAEDFSKAQVHFEEAVSDHSTEAIEAQTVSIPPTGSDAPTLPAVEAMEEVVEKDHDSEVDSAPSSGVDHDEQADAAPAEPDLDEAGAAVESDSVDAAQSDDVPPAGWEVGADTTQPDESETTDDVWADTTQPDESETTDDVWADTTQPDESDTTDDVWADTTDGSDAGWGTATDSASGPWAGDEPATDTWSSGASDDDGWTSESADEPATTDQNVTAATATSWTPGPASDPWATESSQSSSGSLVTSEEVTQSGDDGAFFDGSADDATTDDDPLAAMVREAVDRVTDGDGVN